MAIILDDGIPARKPSKEELKKMKRKAEKNLQKIFRLMEEAKSRPSDPNAEPYGQAA